MFVTTSIDACKIPYALLAGEQAWNVIELCLDVPWFIVPMREFEIGGVGLRTTKLFFDFKEVEKILAQHSKGVKEIGDVTVAIPRSEGKAATWTFHGLINVWSAKYRVRAGDPESKSDLVYEIDTGESFTRMGAPVGTYGAKEIRFSLNSWRESCSSY